jgi:hypothetical protein
MPPTCCPLFSLAFRERQKCLIRSLESEVAGRLAELSLLTEEHEVLQLRSDVLQGAVACREDHVSTHSCCLQHPVRDDACMQLPCLGMFAKFSGLVFCFCRAVASQ